MRLDAQQAGRVREHRAGSGLGEALAAQHLEQHLGVPAGQVGVRLILLRLVAEVSPAVDHLLRRAAADPQLETAAGDEVGRAGVLGHVERVLVAHVDDRRADLDPAGARTDRRQQGERRSQLPREVVHAEVRAVSAQFLGGDGQVNRLQQRVRCRPRLRARRRRPVPERQEANLLHQRVNASRPGGIPHCRYHQAAGTLRQIEVKRASSRGGS
jgi:hypothetical protein